MGALMAKTRTLRLSSEEEKNIESFLRENPFLDFSSLARLAIQTFIKNPTVQIKPLKSADFAQPKRKDIQ